MCVILVLVQSAESFFGNKDGATKENYDAVQVSPYVDTESKFAENTNNTAKYDAPVVTVFLLTLNC